MHVFRHTFATNCYYRGCDVKIPSKLLGHADVNIPYNTYIHLFGDALEEMWAIVC
ncbi:MAG: tyrosine-type recombinase/integrase [Christensenellales bacterium]